MEPHSAPPEETGYARRSVSDALVVQVPEASVYAFVYQDAQPVLAARVGTNFYAPVALCRRVARAAATLGLPQRFAPFNVVLEAAKIVSLRLISLNGFHNESVK